MTMTDLSSTIRAVALAVLMAAPATGGAQGLASADQPAEPIDFDRPEAWAMKWTGSLTLLSSLGPPRAREAGELELSLEADWIPSLSEDQRRVGFNGTKIEDFNRLDVLPRPRLAVGVGWGTTLEVAYLPPVTIEGLTPNLLSAAVERPFLRTGGWTLGLRAYGQVGTVRGDITCPADEAAIPPGAPGNEFGCEEPSNDEATLNHLGLAATAGYAIPGTSDAHLHFGVYATHMDLEFQVDAITYGFNDRSRLATDGWTAAVTAGASFPLSSRLRLAFEAFYSPLEVVRPPSTETDIDPLFNLRSMLTYVF